MTKAVLAAALIPLKRYPQPHRIIPHPDKPVLCHIDIGSGLKQILGGILVRVKHQEGYAVLVRMIDVRAPVQKQGEKLIVRTDRYAAGND